MTYLVVALASSALVLLNIAIGWQLARQHRRIQAASGLPNLQTDEHAPQADGCLCDGGRLPAIELQPAEIYSLD